MINISELSTEVQELSETIDTIDGYSSYQIANLINQVLIQLGRTDLIRQQMMYNYSAKGMINGRKAEKGSVVRYTEEEVTAFVKKFVARRISK